MITTAFITLAQYVAGLAISILPDSTGFPPALSTAATSLGGYLGIFDPLVPITTMATCVTLVFSVEMGIFSYKTIKSVIAHLPQVGGKGH